MRRLYEQLASATSAPTSVPLSSVLHKSLGAVITAPLQAGQVFRLKNFAADCNEATLSGFLKLYGFDLVIAVLFSDGTNFEISIPSISTQALPCQFAIGGGQGTNYFTQWQNPGPFFDVPWDMRQVADQNVAQVIGVDLYTYASILNTDSGAAHTFQQTTAVWYAIHQTKPDETNDYMSIDSFYTKPLT